MPCTSIARTSRFADGVTVLAQNVLDRPFSSASSAYIRLSLAFSASTSFSRFNSWIEAPACFDRHWKYFALLMPCSRRISAIYPSLAPLEDGLDLAFRDRDFRIGGSSPPGRSPVPNGLPEGEAYALTTRPAGACHD